MTVGIARFAPAPVTPEQLPRIDAVLLSHAHFDHLDKPSLERLARGPAAGATVIAARRTRSLIPSGFARVVELGWNDTLSTGGLEIAALRPRHWGARVAVDRRRGFNSYVIQTASGPSAEPRRVLFAGDTADTDAFDHLSAQGGVDLAIFGIGAYAPWEEDHATPEQVWRMFTRLNAGRARRDGPSRLLPMHHSTFPLGQEPPAEPLARLLAAASGEAPRVVARAPGDLWTADARADAWCEASLPAEHAFAAG
jgi:L-ascorbate metabolism protein UlaG (beta-lactamase superfamily)